MRSLLAAVAATTLSITLGASPAEADGTRTLSGPVTGDANVYLTYVGCDSLFGNAAAPTSRINLGPYAAPLGRRSLGLVPAKPLPSPCSAANAAGVPVPASPTVAPLARSTSVQS